MIHFPRFVFLIGIGGHQIYLCPTTRNNPILKGAKKMVLIGKWRCPLRMKHNSSTTSLGLLSFLCLVIIYLSGPTVIGTVAEDKTVSTPTPTPIPTPTPTPSSTPTPTSVSPAESSTSVRPTSGQAHADEVKDNSSGKDESHSESEEQHAVDSGSRASLPNTKSPSRRTTPKAKTSVPSRRFEIVRRIVKPPKLPIATVPPKATKKPLKKTSKARKPKKQDTTSDENGAAEDDVNPIGPVDSNQKGSKITRIPPSTSLFENNICGRVPLYEKRYKLSVNESFSKNTGDSDDHTVEKGEFRILHGMNAVYGEWPWIVLVKICEPMNCAKCTGSLLNSRWVLTAGHCVMEPKHFIYRAEFARYDMLAKEKNSVTINFDKVIRHPNWTEELDDDVTLMRLERPVRYNSLIQPICIVTKQTSDSVKFSKYRVCYNVGYGTVDDANFAEQLQKLSIESRNPAQCNANPTVSLKRGSICIGPRGTHKGASCRVSRVRDLVLS